MGFMVRQRQIEGGRRILLIRGDITEERVDAIVNAANQQLLHGGGVAGAIVRKGGEEIQEECRPLAPVPVGGAVLTSAGRLPARAVIHAVGPVYGHGDDDRLLAEACRSALELASQHGFGTIALPAISSGIFGFPRDRCARILLAAAEEYLLSNPDSSLREVRFTVIDDGTLAHFARAFDERSGVPAGGPPA